MLRPGYDEDTRELRGNAFRTGLRQDIFTLEGCNLILPKMASIVDPGYQITPDEGTKNLSGYTGCT